jgi:hypothetical protein
MLCDHPVMLDESCWQYEAFADLPGYLRWHVVPDRRIQDEAMILAAAGEWIGEQVLGPIGAALAAAAPATVWVRGPEASGSSYFPPSTTGTRERKARRVTEHHSDHGSWRRLEPF